MKLIKSKKIQVGFYSILSLLLGFTIGLTIYFTIVPLILDQHYVPRPAYMNVKIIEHVDRPLINIDENSYNIKGMTGNLIITTNTISVNLLLALLSLLRWGSIVTGLFLIRIIILNIYGGRFFEKNNIRYTKIIGLMIIFLPLVRAIVQFIIFKVINEAPFLQKINGFELDKGYDLSLSTLLLGIFVYMFSQIFNEGFRLKQENDLTV